MKAIILKIFLLILLLVNSLKAFGLENKSVSIYSTWYLHEYLFYFIDGFIKSVSNHAINTYNKVATKKSILEESKNNLPELNCNYIIHFFFE